MYNIQYSMLNIQCSTIKPAYAKASTGGQTNNLTNKQSNNITIQQLTHQYHILLICGTKSFRIYPNPLQRLFFYYGAFSMLL